MSELSREFEEIRRQLENQTRTIVGMCIILFFSLPLVVFVVARFS